MLATTRIFISGFFNSVWHSMELQKDGLSNHCVQLETKRDPIYLSYQTQMFGITVRWK